MSARTRTGQAVLRWRVAGGVLISLTAGLGLLVPGMQAALAASQGPASLSSDAHFVVPAGAASGPIVSGFRMTKCIDDSNDSSTNDTPLVMWTCNGSAEQNWTIETDGTIQINGKCMDIYRDGKTKKTRVELWTCHGGVNQQWQAVSGTLVNPVSGKCLDDPRFNAANGTQLEIYTCNGGRNQLWELP